MYRQLRFRELKRQRTIRNYDYPGTRMLANFSYKNHSEVATFYIVFRFLLFVIEKEII